MQLPRLQVRLRASAIFRTVGLGRSLIICALCLGASDSCFAAVAYCSETGPDHELRAQEPVLIGRTPQWQIAFKKGDTTLHRRTVRLLPVSPDPTGMSSTIIRSIEKVEVRDVNAKGEATIVTNCVSAGIVRGDVSQSIDKASFPPTTRVFSKTGILFRETDGSETSKDPLLVAESMLANCPAPEGSIRAGTSWNTTLQNRLFPSKVATLVTRFEGRETISGISVMKTSFKLDLPAPSPDEPDRLIRADGVRSIDISTGHVVRFQAEVREVSIGPDSSLRWNVSILDELVLAGVNDKPTGDRGELRPH